MSPRLWKHKLRNFTSKKILIFTPKQFSSKTIFPAGPFQIVVYKTCCDRAHLENHVLKLCTKKIVKTLGFGWKKKVVYTRLF